MVNRSSFAAPCPCAAIENKIIFTLKIASALSFKRTWPGKLKSNSMILLQSFALKNH
jgi:hypothetical protein